MLMAGLNDDKIVDLILRLTGLPSDQREYVARQAQVLIAGFAICPDVLDLNYQAYYQTERQWYYAENQAPWS